MKHNLTNVPSTLRQRPQWVLWRTIQRDGNPTKVPFQINGTPAKPNDATTWSTFDEAVAAFEQGGYDGIGFMFSADDEFCGIDLDGARDPKTGKIEQWAKDIILEFDTYTEVSPSETGAKLFILGKLPFGGRKHDLTDVPKIGDKQPGVEVYDRRRYFAVTGLRLTGPTEPQARQELLTSLCKRYWPEQQATPVADFNSPDAVVDRARKYLVKVPPAISGSSGHNATFYAACILVLGFSLTNDQALQVLAEWNQTCQPPWSERELEHKVASAFKQPGDRGYLRNTDPHQWSRVAVPTYEAPQQNDKRETSTLDAAAEKYILQLKSGGTTLIETGLPGLDKALGGGIEAGEMIVIAARPSHGKAQPLDSLVLTPTGYVAMGELSPGDAVTGSNGKSTRVNGIFPQGEQDVYQVTFSDRTQTECTLDHLWWTQTRKERRRGVAGSVKTLEEIITSLQRPDTQSPNHMIPLVSPVDFQQSECALRLHPYLLGLLLGDGCFGQCISFMKPGPDVVQRLKALLPPQDEGVVGWRGKINIRRKVKNNDRSETAKALEACGLDRHGSVEKFIPWEYLYAPISSRLELLQGLIDTDGHVTKEGTTIEYSSSSKRLADDITFLARSLGAIVLQSSRIPVYTNREGEKQDGQKSFRVFIRMTNGLTPVSSVKHLARFKPSIRFYRSITKVEWSRRSQCQCITVSSHDMLYVTDNFTLTHNSLVGLQCAHHWTAKGMPVLFITEEMSIIALGKRALQYLSEIPEEDWVRSIEDLSRDLGDYRSGRAKCYLIASCGNVERAIEEIERAVREDEIKAVIVDYAQLLQSSGSSRYDQASRTSEALRRVANEQHVIMLVLCQLNREIEKRKTFIPVMSDIKETGQFEQDADVIVFLVWPHRLDSTLDAHEFKFYVAKNRNRAICERVVTCCIDPARQQLTQESKLAKWKSNYDPSLAAFNEEPF